MPRRRRPVQRELIFGHGGWRPGAGRPKSKRRNKRVLHRRRPVISRRNPAHISLKMRPDIGKLRTKDRVAVIRRAFIAACAREGFRIIDWSIQNNHLHLIVEADDNVALARGMQSFKIRVAKGLNRLARRSGPVFIERYHIRVLETPGEVRNARAYCINNFRRHAAQAGHRVDRIWADPYSSWAWFDGWQDLPRVLERAAAREREGPPVVTRPKSWLLRVGWQRRGLVPIDEVPALRRGVSTVRVAY